MGLFEYAKKVISDAKRASAKSQKGAAKKKGKGKKKSVKKKTVIKTKKVTEKEIGVVTHYFGKISVGIIKLKAPLNVGDKIHIKGAHDDFRQVIKSMQLNHKDIRRGKKGDEIGIKVKARVHENDRVYKVTG